MATGLDAQQKIFSTNPDDRRAFEALEEQYFLEGDWEALVELYRARIDAPSIADDLSQKSPLLFRLGQILEERVLDADAATETYWTLARLDPTNRPALRQLRGMHQRRAQWDMVLQIAELESQTTMPPYERAAFEAELGRTWKEHLGDPEEAAAAFERALEADPDFPAALEGLAALHQEAGRLREAATILERLTDRLRGPERAPVWIALGTLLAGPLDERSRARRCFQSALEDDPFQAPAVEWSLLLATEAEDWDAVSELLESRFDLASGARARAAIAVEASQIQLNHLGSPARARAWVDRATELHPDDPSVLLAACDVDRADGDRDALLANLDRLTVAAGRHMPQSALIEAAELHADFGHTDQALVAIRRAAEREGPHDERVLILQARLLREDGAKHELAEVLETLTALEAAGSSESRASMLRELAAIQEEDLGDEEAAVQTWRRAFDLEPGAGPALDALERLHGKLDDGPALREVFERAIEAERDEADADLFSRHGQLLLERFDDLPGARSRFDRALELDDDCSVALRGLRVIADASDDPDLLLEVCTREARDLQDGDAMGELARSAAPILDARGDLEGALDWLTRWTGLSTSNEDAWTRRADLERRLDRPEAEVDSRRTLARLLSGPERVDALLRQATLHRTLGQTTEAGTALEQALEDRPGDETVLTSLCEVYRALGRPQDLVRVLRLLADCLPREDQAEPLEELAATLQDPLGDLDTAIVVRWRLAELPDCPAEAPGKLEALLELAGRYAELAHLLFTRRQQLGDDTNEAFELDLRRATLLLDSLGHCEEAAEIFAALHERHPKSDEILDLLERALRAGDDAAGLCDLLERRAGWAENDEKRADLELERATITEEALGERQRACDLYARILRDFPDAPAADRADRRLERLLETLGEWDRLRDHLLDRTEQIRGDEEISLREQIATLCRDRLQDMAACAEQLERIAEITTDRVHVWQQLADIYAHDLNRPGDWLRVVEAELATEPDEAREFALRVNAARLCLDDEKRPADRDPEAAYAHYERVLELEPTHAEAAEVLAMHYGKQARHDDTARILEARLAHLDDHSTADALDLRLRLATLYADRLDDDERARPHFEAALEGLGARATIADPLAALYERGDDDEALAELARSVLEREDLQAEALVWRVRLGRAEHALGRFDAAATAYRAAAVDSPDDREIEDALIEIYEHEGESEPLVELLEKRLPFARQDETIELRLRLARLHADARDEPEEALRHLEGILDAHPQHRDAFAHALELAQRMAAPERLLSLLDRALETTLPDEERASLLERRAKLLAEELDSPEQAVLAYREALSFDRQRETVRSALRTQLERLERWPAVLDCLFVEAMESPTDQRVAIYEEAAEIAWSRLSPDASLPWLARLREERPEDPELFARLAEVHRRAGRFEAALRALDEELLRRSGDEERCDLHLQRARLLERELHSPGRAIGAYREALELANHPDEILAELDRLLDLMGRPGERAEILEARIEGSPERERTPLRRTLSSLYCVDLSRPERAVPHLEAIVDATTEPLDRMTALGALDAALRAAGRHDAWIATAEAELALIEAEPAVAENTPAEFERYLREELARTWDELMGDADRALAHLRILCRDETRATSEQRERLRALLRRTGRRAELAVELAAHLEDGRGDAHDWLELGRLREEALLDLGGARTAYREAEVDGELRLAAIRGQRRTSERLRDWDAVAHALEAEYHETDRLDRRERVALARRLGDLCWQRLGSGERAASGYQLALDLDAHDLEALRRLIDVREACQEQEAAIALYRRELELLDEDDATSARRREVWLRLASLHADAPDAESAAVEAYEQAAALDRLAAPDELRLARLYAATGDDEAFCATFGRWCDRTDGAATLDDHLELAHALVERGRADEAHARCDRATTIAPESARAWRLRGELDREAGRWNEAAEAFERAADHAPTDVAATDCVAAATCLEATDLEAAHALLVRATELEPGHLEAHLARTRVAGALEQDAETETEATTTLELSRAASLEDAVRLEVALLGGRAARRLGHTNESRRLFEEALDLDGDQVEALEGVALAHFEDGDPVAARPLLERRLDLPGENLDRARHLAMIARGLEAEELLDAAWARYEDALDADRSVESAHEGLVRVHERAARPEEAMRALERWSESSADRETRAAAAFRAAEHALALDRKDTASTHLEYATETDPQLAPAWLLLCDLSAERASDEQTQALCTRALEAIEPSPLSAQISLRAARLAEVAGDLDVARERYGEAARWDPRASEAALCESRLARRAGEWVEADGVLSQFLDRHPDAESPSLAHVHLERGRLLSGPLEDVDAAIASYEKALALQPDLGVARTALGRLLLHSTERWREALAIHRELLETNPTAGASLRAVIRIAENRGQSEVAEGGLAVLRALGLASPEEDATGAAALRVPIHPGPPMVDEEAERLRRIAHLANEELGSVLRGAVPDRASSTDEEIDRAIQQICDVEDELCAPGLARLDADDRAALFSSLGALFLDPGGNGAESRFRASLDEALGRWTRRKVRRIVEETTIEAIEAHDHAAWGDALRAIAAAQVVDRTGGTLAPVLRALLLMEPGSEEAPAFESAEISTLTASSPTARALLSRILTQLCDRLERGR